jgi:hypothetical protein
MIQFFETPELAKLMVAGSGGVDVFLKYHLSFNNKCTFSSASDQCAAFLNTEWIIQQPYFSSTGRLQYAHDGAGFHNQALGIFKDAQFEESDMTARIPARIYAADQYYVPKYTLRIGLVSIDCSVLSVLSTSARSELIVTLQDEPSAITLTDGTPLVISAFDI